MSLSILEDLVKNFISKIWQSFPVASTLVATLILPSFRGNILGELHANPISAAILPAPNPIPYLKLNPQSPPVISAKAAVLLEPSSHTILWGKNLHQKLSIASTTKIMTAIVVMKYLPLEKEVEIKNLYQQGSQMGLVKGEKITVLNLLWGMLLNSGNDAAWALATSVDGGVVRFVELMNQEVNFFQLKNTHFTDPMGISNSTHYSSAYDLAVLAKYALNNPIIAEIVATPKKVVTSSSRDRWHHLKNTNPLLGKIQGVIGIKTGYTPEAGECLALAVERGERKLILIILGSEDRKKDAEDLINWGFENYSW